MPITPLTSRDIQGISQLHRHVDCSSGGVDMPADFRQVVQQEVERLRAGSSKQLKNACRPSNARTASVTAGQKFAASRQSERVKRVRQPPGCPSGCRAVFVISIARRTRIMRGQATRCDQSRHSSSSACSPRVRAEYAAPVARGAAANRPRQLSTSSSSARSRRAIAWRRARSRRVPSRRRTSIASGRSTTAGPMLNAVIEISATAIADAEALDAERKSRQSARPPARHSHPDQRQHRHRGHGELRRIARARRQPPEAGRVHRHAPARGGCGDSRQDQPERVGQFPLDAIDVRLELARRPDEESVRARPQSVRLELGDRRGHRREPRVDRRRHRDGWQHHLSRLGEWTGRPQANGGPRQPPRNHSDFRDAGHGRPNGALGGGCGDVADRARGSGRGRPCHRAGKRQNS